MVFHPAPFSASVVDDARWRWCFGSKKQLPSPKDTPSLINTLSAQDRMFVENDEEKRRSCVISHNVRKYFAASCRTIPEIFKPTHHCQIKPPKRVSIYQRSGVSFKIYSLFKKRFSKESLLNRTRLMVALISEFPVVSQSI